MNKEFGNASKKNKMLLLLILMLDLIGFSLIFPLIPSLLEYYIADPGNMSIDSWLPDILSIIRVFLPVSEPGSQNVTVIAGGFITSLYAFFQFIFTPWWGRLSDHFGRRPVLLITGLGLALSYLIWFFSTSFTMFLISRILGGMMAGNMGVATASMADMSNEEDRTRSMGLLGAAFGIGFIIGPVIGGIASTWDMTQSWPNFHFLHPFSTASLTAFVLSIIGALLNIAFFKETYLNRKSNRNSWIANPFSAIKKELPVPGFSYLLSINFLFILLFSGFEFSLSFFYRLDFSLTSFQIGLVFLFSGVVIVFGQGYLIRKLTGRLENRVIFIGGAMLMTLPAALMPLAPPSVPASLISLFFISLGVSLVQPSLTGLASLMIPANRQGVAMGSFRSAGSLARVVGPGLGAYLYWSFGVGFTYIFLGTMLAVVSVMGFGLRPYKKA